MSYPAISLATATVGRHRCPQKRLQTARQPPVYPNSSPDHRACNSLTPSAVLTPSIPVHRWIRDKETLLEVRHYIFDLKPYLAGEKGIVSVVENQIREFNNVARVPASLEARGQERDVPVPVATCLYRVTQEALSNAFKHSRASQVKVSLDFGPDGVGSKSRTMAGGSTSRLPTMAMGLATCGSGPKSLRAPSC